MREIEIPPRILLVDDVAANLEVLSGALEPLNYEILAASNGTAALKVAARARPDLILLDVLMPDLDGFEICRRLKENRQTADIPVIFLTARRDMPGLVEGFKAGAVDYVIKPFQPEEVVSRVSTHVRLSRLSRELLEKNRALECRTAELTEEIQRRRVVESALKRADDRLTAISDLEAARWNLSGLIGGSAVVQKIISEIQRLHQFVNTGVLITGESGTGKELVARAIHYSSLRSKGPFIPINCVAIPPDLAESILFGHTRGAFTSAIADRKGCFEMADGGTLFLDEIGDMPAGIQVKLLRVLEDGCITPVGASEPRKVDVRVVAATNADLPAKISIGSFRQDLYFRLARYTVVTPPLRSRREDVPLLARHFLSQFAVEMGLPPAEISAAAMGALCRYTFPGNVRELKNIMERALINSGGLDIEPEHLSLMPELIEAAQNGSTLSQTNESKPAKANGRKLGEAPLPLNLAEAEDLLIQRALDETGGNITEAARLLGVHRTRVYRKLAQQDNGNPPAVRS